MLITQNQDTEGSDKRGSEEAAHPESLHTHFSARTSVRVLESIPLLIAIAIPFTVQAGFLSSLLVSFQSDEPVPVDATVQPSEIALLSAHTTADPKAAIGGGDILVSEGALVPGGIIGDDVAAEDVYRSGEISLYVVREGDTLSQIAEMFDVNSNTILWANDLPSATAIQPGETLVILPITGVRHVVKDGDTISTIAKKYDGDVDEILSYNQLATADDITVGDTVVVPGGNMQQATARPAAAATPVKVTGSAASASSFMHPLPGGVRTQGIHGYNAVDIAATAGTPIRAAASGEVIVSKSGGWNGGYGNYIVIRHGNGTQTLYAHLNYNAVGVGAFVGAGSTIGSVGNTGRSTGAHLHFEVRGARNPF